MASRFCLRWIDCFYARYSGEPGRLPTAAYPQPVAQKPGIGFPMARIAAVFSLACGAVLDLGICRYAGKGQSELGMLRTLWNIFRPGDIMLADRLMCSWMEMVLLEQRDVDCVCRFTSHRTADFRRGTRLGKDDHIVKWFKPTKLRSVDREAYNLLPDFLMVRETRVRVEQPGFRSKTLIIATTLLDAEEFTRKDLADLYFFSLECGARSEVPQGNDGDGHPALLVAGVSSEGNLDAHPGLQSDPHDHRPSGQQTR